MQTCPRCNGAGYINWEHDGTSERCPVCKGQCELDDDFATQMDTSYLDVCDGCGCFCVVVPTAALDQYCAKCWHDASMAAACSGGEGVTVDEATAFVAQPRW